MDMVTCPTCGGTGTVVMRGAARQGYDEPDYPDNCGICGGGGELPASLFSGEDADEEYDDSLAWSA